MCFRLLGSLLSMLKVSEMLLVALLLASIFIPCTTAANDIDEGSIPAPTRLSILATNAGTETKIIRTQDPILSDDSWVEISTIEVLGAGLSRHWGIKVSLSNDDHSDSLYLDADQASQLRDEFIGLLMWYQRNFVCDAGRCEHGVARCRPSQTKRQAFCPGFYSTQHGERGVMISTTKNSFSLPSITPSEFVTVIDAALTELRQYSSP